MSDAKKPPGMAESSEGQEVDRAEVKVDGKQTKRKK